MSDQSFLVVGRPFPQPLVDGATFWSTEDNLIVICDKGLAEETHEALTVERIWVTFDGPLIVLTLAVAGGFSAEIAGTWLEGHSRPLWLDDETDGRLLLTVVWVEETDKRIVRIQSFTLSPHATGAIRRRAVQEWVEPRSGQAMLQAVASWRRRYPDDRSVKAAAIATSRPGA